MTRLEQLTELVESPVSRRQFAKNVGLTGAGLAATSLLGATALGGLAIPAAGQSATITPSTITDVDILNFALNLEYLEAEFYTVAGTGKTLVESGIIPASAQTGPTTGGHIVSFPDDSDHDGSVAYLEKAIKHDEQQHVLLLRAALGSAAIKKPAINLDALGFGFRSDSEFLLLSRAFEDTGVSAYAGAAPLIQSHSILSVAARIAETEAQHAGSIRQLIIRRGLTSPAVDGKDVPPTMTHPFFVDSKGLSIPRTTRQVLNIVYHSTGCSGGFFPAGFNGKIKC